MKLKDAKSVHRGPANATESASWGASPFQARPPTQTIRGRSAARYSKCESRGEIALRERLDRARVEGDLSATADAAELAGYITTILTHVG